MIAMFQDDLDQGTLGHFLLEMTEIPSLLGEVHLLDYGAGNVRSVVNALEHLGASVQLVRDAQDLEQAKVEWYHYIYNICTIYHLYIIWIIFIVEIPAHHLPGCGCIR